MKETLTGQKLAGSYNDYYYVYNYLRPAAVSALPESIWQHNHESEVSKALRAADATQGAYLSDFSPRVCVRKNLFAKCAQLSKAPLKPDLKLRNEEEKLLCDFIATHSTMFSKVKGA